MQSIRQFEQFLWDNIYFLYSAPTKQILTTSLAYLKPNIKIDPTAYLLRYSVDDWVDRWEYVIEDDEGEVVDPDGLREVLHYTAMNLYGKLQEWERNLKRIQLQYGETDIFLCPHCGRLHSEAERTDMDTNSTLCQTCAFQLYAVCDHCDTLTARHRTYQVLDADGDHISICQACSAEAIGICPTCRRSVLNTTRMVLDVAGHSIEACTQCKDNIVRECEECGTSFPFINRIEQHGAEGSHCDKCLFDAGSYNSYRYKPSVLHFKTIKSEVQRKDTMFFGLELECELGHRAGKTGFANRLKRHYTHKDMYIVHDGSLNHGIEVVLMPFSDLWYKHNKKWLITLYERMYALGGRFNRPKVGLHIHTSKAAWSQSQIYKIMRFCYAPENARMLERFFGRGSCEHARKNEYEYSGAVDVAKSGKNYDNGHHYNMINMSTGTTVEFRMFQGTNRIKRVFSYLDFIRALHEFTLTTGLKYISMANFILFVNRRRKYKSIQPYFKEVK